VKEWRGPACADIWDDWRDGEQAELLRLGSLLSQQSCEVFAVSRQGQSSSNVRVRAQKRVQAFKSPSANCSMCIRAPPIEGQKRGAQLMADIRASRAVFQRDVEPVESGETAERLGNRVAMRVTF